MTALIASSQSSRLSSLSFFVFVRGLFRGLLGVVIFGTASFVTLLLVHLPFASVFFLAFLPCILPFLLIFVFFHCLVVV